MVSILISSLSGSVSLATSTAALMVTGVFSGVEAESATGTGVEFTPATVIVATAVDVSPAAS